MTRRKTSKPPVRSSDAGASAGDPLLRLLPAVAATCFAIRWLVPAESAAEGDTLWIAQLWLGAALLWWWIQWRSDQPAIRLTAYDVAVWILVSAQVLSAVVCDGQRRAALNMAWEWVALGSSLFLLRQVFANSAHRADFIRMFVGLAVAVSVLGLWQHYVWYPQTSQRVAELLSEQRKLAAPDSQQPPVERLTRQRRLAELESELRGLPAEEPARTLFLKRLMASREPLGFFALANTLAGVLAVALFFAAMLPLSGSEGRLRRLPVVAATVVVGGPILMALVLTKSRTAWVGTLVGSIAWYVVRNKESRSSPAGRPLSYAMVGVLGSVLIVAFAAATGGLDRKILTEAGKSLSYRFEYWQGTWQVIRRRPWLGTGPGNFRQHYLRYKLAGSSEEIADPHNMVLDVWAKAGILGLAGLLAVLALGTHGLIGRRRPANDTQTEKTRSAPVANDRPRPRWWKRPFLAGGAAAFLLAAGVLYLFEGLVDERLLWLLPVYAGSVALAGWCWHRTILRISLLLSGWLALAVHLLGAGGIAMPAVTQTLLVLPLLVSGPEQRREWRVPAAVVQPGGLLVIGGCLVAVFAGCLLTTTRPVLMARAFKQSADSAAAMGRLAEAERLYREATRQDRLDPGPWFGLSELEFQRWAREVREATRATGEASAAERHFVAGRRAAWEAIARDPYSYALYRHLANWLLFHGLQSGRRDSIEEAVELLQQAVTRYPTHPGVRAELAHAWARLGEPERAAREAAEALRLDEINRRRGHEDRFLPEPTRQSLQKLAAKGSPEAAPIVD